MMVLGHYRVVLDGTWWYWVSMTQSLLVLGVDGLDTDKAHAFKSKQLLCLHLIDSRIDPGLTHKQPKNVGLLNLFRF